MRRVVRISVFVLVLGLVLGVLLLAASIHTYHALTAETLIAELRFERTGEREYLAHLRTGDLCDERTFPLYGDQWRLDAQFLKWKYWAVLLGLDSQYRLERIEGRYRTVADQNAMPTRSHALAPETALDIAAVGRALGPLNFLTDATYGSSTYHDIDAASAYLVYKSPTGIFTRVADPERARPDAAGLAVEVRAGCGAGPGVLERVAGWADTAALAVLDGKGG